jgi:hypothetical protein
MMDIDKAIKQIQNEIDVLILERQSLQEKANDKLKQIYKLTHKIDVLKDRKKDE